MSTLWLAFSSLACHLFSDDGVSFYVRNYANKPVNITFILMDPERGNRTVGTAEVHLARGERWGGATWFGHVDPFVVRAIVCEPSGRVLADLETTWPGEGTFPEGGDSPQIAVQLVLNPEGVAFDESI